MIDVRRSWKCSRWQTSGLLKSKSKAFGLGCHPASTDDQEVCFQHTWCKRTLNRCQWVHLSKKLTQANLQKLQYVLWLLTLRDWMRRRCLKHSTCLVTEWWLPYSIINFHLPNTYQLVLGHAWNSSDSYAVFLAKQRSGLGLIGFLNSSNVLFGFIELQFCVSSSRVYCVCVQHYLT